MAGRSATAGCWALHCWRHEGPNVIAHRPHHAMPRGLPSQSFHPPQSMQIAVALAFCVAVSLRPKRAGAGFLGSLFTSTAGNAGITVEHWVSKR
jgi:hypothetical protein